MVTLHHIHHMRSVDVIILQLSPFRPKACLVMRLSGKVEIGFERIVEKDPIGISLMQPHVKRNTPVERVLVKLEGVCIRIPVDESPSPEVQMGWLITQTEECLIGKGMFGAIHII